MGTINLLFLLFLLFNPVTLKPCSELTHELRHFACDCELLTSFSELGASNNNGDVLHIGVAMTCDAASFGAEMAPLPRGAPIYKYKHSYAGLRVLPPQMFTTGTPLAPLETIDLSGNSIRRLSGGQLLALRDTLVGINLADNMLGDTLNPILSTGEFRNLPQLMYLDLSRNGIRALEAGIFRGCAQLKELKLDGNLLTNVPANELGGPLALRSLYLRDNNIDELPTRIFASKQIPSLETLDISGNGLTNIAGGAFIGVPHLGELRLAYNRISRLDSDAFEGTKALRVLDLANNYLTEIPGVALTRHTSTLTHLDLSSNRIRSLDNEYIGKLSTLLVLNISRNEISNLAPGTFLGLRRLRYLDISVNSLRAVEDDAFEGLDSLEELVITDNNVLLVPASALGRLPKLRSLHLDFNRIAAVSGDIVGSVAERAEELSLARNVIRELPDGTFRRCKRLRKLDLTGNLLTGTPSIGMFIGTEVTLQELHLPYNKLTGWPAELKLSTLRTLDLSNNRLVEISSNALEYMTELRYLNLSGNTKLGNGLPSELISQQSYSQLEVVDLRKTGIQKLPVKMLLSMKSLQELYLSDNMLTELGERSFMNFPNLTLIDLSNNKIATIKPHSFINVMSIRQLNLAHNRLVSYTGETFNTGTGLVNLDLSDNRLTYISPTSFRIHPRLESLKLGDNRLTFFPATELIVGLQYLTLLDLSGNKLIGVDELDFSRLPRLRDISFARNALENVGDLAFHNSSQLQILDLSENKLARLNERALEGLSRLRFLNLSFNQLIDLPDTVFDKTRIQALESVDLSFNGFETADALLRALHKQHFALTNINLSNNKLTTVPADDSVLNNVDRLDLSFNPLIEDAVNAVLSEPKTVRVLNLASTGLRHVTGKLETPFLQHLNLSMNNITKIDSSAFERTSLLQTLDLSHNLLKNVSLGTQPPPGLTKFIFSHNPIERVSSSDLVDLKSLRHLELSHLPLCTRVERDAFLPLRKLKTLDAYGYPILGYLDVKGILQHIPVVEKLNIECMDSIFGGAGESITSELHPVRLKELGIHGSRVSAIAPGALSGLRAPFLTVRLTETSLNNLPPTLFFPVPRSTSLALDLTDTQLQTVSPQLLAAIEDRRGKINVLGLDKIPLNCDCSARPLRHQLVLTTTESLAKLTCFKPEKLVGVRLIDTTETDLSCGVVRNGTGNRPLKRMTTTTSPSSSRLPSRISSTPASEPDIIWSVEPRPPARSRGGSNTSPQPAASTPNNDDTLIIGIVGGVVAFIAILIIGICIVRLKMSSGNHQHMGPPGSVCGACSTIKGPPSLYAAFPPHHAASIGRPSPTPAMSYQQPYFVPYHAPMPLDDKMSSYR